MKGLAPVTQINSKWYRRGAPGQCTKQSPPSIKLALQCPISGPPTPIILSTPFLWAGPGQTRPSTGQDQAEIMASPSQLLVPAPAHRPGSPRPLPPPPLFPFSGLLSPTLPPPPNPKPRARSLCSPFPHQATSWTEQGPVICPVGPSWLNLACQSPRTAGQKWWAGRGHSPWAPNHCSASLPPAMPSPATEKACVLWKEGRGLTPPPLR